MRLSMLWHSRSLLDASRIVFTSHLLKSNVLHSYATLNSRLTCTRQACTCHVADGRV